LPTEVVFSGVAAVDSMSTVNDLKIMHHSNIYFQQLKVCQTEIRYHYLLSVASLDDEI